MQLLQNKTVSIIIPALNEEKNLKKTINEFVQYLNKQIYDYEIIIINDGSTDKTKEKIIELQEKFQNIILMEHKFNQGKGASVRKGLLTAKGDFRLFIDADNATSIDHLDQVWSQFEKSYDIVIASRNKKDVPNTKMLIPQSAWKRFLGRFGNLIIQKVMGTDIWDTQCGFKIFTKEATNNILSKTMINRWAIDIEILTIASLQNYKIAKIPVEWKNSDESRVKPIDYIKTLIELLKIKTNEIKGKYK